MNPFKLMRAKHLLFALASLVLVSCTKEVALIPTDDATDYYITEPGKYITYRTDSTVFTNFGTQTVVRSYQEKHQVNAMTTDNLGRPSYRIFRYLRDLSGTQGWTPVGSYYITPTQNSIEVIEDNLRSVKLIQPIKKDISWKGNGFLPYDPYGSNFGPDWSLDDAMVDWTYQYKAVDESVQLNNRTIPNVVTVTQVEDSINVPLTVPQSYGSLTRAIDKYAKGIGLVYQELTMWDYQPANGARPAYRTGFGVRRTMIEHN